MKNTPREKHIGLRLAGIDGISGLSGEPAGRLGQQDVGRSLATILLDRPLEVPQLVDMARHLARTLAAVHRRGVLHLNINPAHIIVRGERRVPSLIGFELATTVWQPRPVFALHRGNPGVLAYVAPEQTGRTGRGVDLRADLYSLGASLYEAATGHPPFDSRDPLQLLRDHLVRVPVPPERLNGGIPAALSQIIMRLLEKDPEKRYQSGEGLLHDLELVWLALSSAEAAPMQLGERDFPVRLSAPSRLVGRDSEIAALEHALSSAVAGECRVVLVAGAPGVGKTSLMNELRPMVTSRRGWFVSGKFDQFRHDAPGATIHALRALGRLLLAEPEAELAARRERIQHALGNNAGLICSIPEFAALLGPQAPEPWAEPAKAEARLLASTVDLLRAVACAERPLVVVLDDLQWAPAPSVRFLDSVLHAARLPGLLVVGSYRHSDVSDAAHPLAAAMARWQGLQVAPMQLCLGNLPATHVREMLEEMMRLPLWQAAALAVAVREHTGGNPYDSIELLNALRGDGSLRPGPSGWEWDAKALRRYVGKGGVLDLINVRIARLPEGSQRLLQAISCLGGEVRRSLLCAATGLSPAALDEKLAAALEDGLLAIDPGDDSALRLRHDRVQQAAYASLQPARRRALHLELARRLAEAPRYAAAAAEQYLSVCDDIQSPQECRAVARLLQDAALNARKTAHFALTERLLSAALALMSRLASPAARDQAMCAQLEVEHHVALCALGWFEAADALYGVIEARGAPVQDWLLAACAQVDSLQARSRQREAIGLGLALLKRLGCDVPGDFRVARIEQRLACLGDWLSNVDVGRDPRPHTGDARSTALVMLFNRLTYPAHMVDLRVMGWLILEAHAIWVRHGPSPELTHTLASTGAVAIGLNLDYHTGYHASLHALKVSESRGWEPSTSQARFVLAGHAGHWYEPLEDVARQLHLAREGLLRSGDLQLACLTYRPSTSVLLDCSPTLAALADEVDAALDLASRVHSEFITATMEVERQLLNGLRGDAPADAEGREPQAVLARQSATPALAISAHFTRALLAALFGDTRALATHAAAAMQYVSAIANYRGAMSRVMQMLALAQTAREGAIDKAQRLTEFDLLREWLAARAADAPHNFLHLLHWMDAERACACQNFLGAARGFDTALSLVETRPRAWHHALICERSGLLHLEHGIERTGRQLIAQAQRLYRDWGATRKVRHLERTHGFLARAADPGPQPAPGAPAARPADAIDMMALLRASQALSSETSLARLETRVAGLMSALTGATGVRLALWDAESGNWLLASTQGPAAPRMTVDEAAARRLVPLSAFQYAERTREYLLVDDALADDRFARDPYFAAIAHCSLLFVPILSKGKRSAMLLLENRLSRGAFGVARLDAVSLIAGQLAVSLENALLYDQLERQVGAQTRELLATARRAGMAQIAINVLHNVGNVLNSVNVSARVLNSRITRTLALRVLDVADLLCDESSGPGRELANADAQSRMIPAYLRELGMGLVAERDELLRELESLTAGVDHIGNIVAMQLSYAGATGGLEDCKLTDVIDDALRLEERTLLGHRITVVRDYEAFEPAPLDRTRLIQIFVNLIENAAIAMSHHEGERILRIAARHGAGAQTVDVIDTGSGIAPEHLEKIFAHGFTTRPQGHGFGLHSCAVAAREIGGGLMAQSPGLGRGATFTLSLPCKGNGT